MRLKLSTLTTVIGLLVLVVNMVVAAELDPTKSNRPADKGNDQAVTGEEVAVLSPAPNVPPPIKRKHATKVIVTLEFKEVTRPLSDGVDYEFWTFGGEVPGSFIRVREGDLVEFHLTNHPSSKLPHSLDLHAVTGPDGGATSTLTAPGHTSQFSFKVLNPGLYVYHCSMAPVPMHVGNGMYGLILVEPKEGMLPVDKEYYVMQGEFYTAGKFGEAGLQTFDQDKAVDEKPSYVVFNGAVGSLLGDKAIRARVGDTIRLFVGNGGPNLISSFHVIGEIFDRVYADGSSLPTQKNVQTTLIPVGGSAIVEFQVQVPGTYSFVDHSLNRAFNKGAMGMLKVDGPENPLVYSARQVDADHAGKQVEAGSVGEKKVASAQAAVAEDSKGNSAFAGLTKEIQMEKGKRVYMQTCFVCHQPTGLGLPGVFPPLAGSDYLMADKGRSIRGVIKGQSGEMVVNGKKYNGIMPPVILNDEQVANVLTYVRSSWGNTGDVVTIDEVRKVRGGDTAH